MSRRKSFLCALLAGTIGCAAASAAGAAVVTLTFEGVNTTYPSNEYANVAEFYNGGTSSVGTSGANLGVSFAASAIAYCFNSATETCSATSRGGVGDPASANTGIFFETSENAYLNVAAGFDTGFAFTYSSYFPNGSVRIYSGLNGTGVLLASIAVPENAVGCPAYNAQYCPFGSAGAAFAGIARSVDFGEAGGLNGPAFDDLTLGASRPGMGPGIPEPTTWALMLLGFFAAGSRVRRSRRRPAH
jgi:hypothetical protein